jgi:hypothetical protein
LVPPKLQYSDFFGPTTIPHERYMGTDVGLGPAVGLPSIQTVIETVLALASSRDKIDFEPAHFDPERNVLFGRIVAILPEAIDERAADIG